MNKPLFEKLDTIEAAVDFASDIRDRIPPSYLSMSTYDGLNIGEHSESLPERTIRVSSGEIAVALGIKAETSLSWTRCSGLVWDKAKISVPSAIAPSRPVSNDTPNLSALITT